MRTSLCFVILLGLAGPCFGIGPPPQTGLLQKAEPVYFRMRPDIVDVPQIPATTGHTGTCRALVVLVDFQDKPADLDGHDPGFFQDLLFSGSRPSMQDYFLENSYGRFTVHGDVYGWLRAECDHNNFVNRDLTAGTADDYGLDISSAAIQPAVCEYPLNVWGLVKHAVLLADDAVDFSEYDNDGPDGVPDSGDDDGFVDALFVVHSGLGAEVFGGSILGVDYIWSMQSSLEYYTPTEGTRVDGVGVGPFVLVPEFGEIGVFAHEFCHLLGLPDLYNTETGDPVVGPFCLMDEGAWNGPMGKAGSVPSHLSAPMKFMLGWVDPEKVCLGCDGSPEIAGAEIGAHGTSSRPYQVLGNPAGMDWSEQGGGTGEYFILENRQAASAYYESYLPASGLVIWKVDESRPDNNNASGRLAEIIQADGEVVDPHVPGMNIPDGPSDVWPGSLGKQEFTPKSFPASSLSGNRFSGVAVENIVQTIYGTITADIRVGLPKKGNTYAYPNPYSLRESSPLRIVFVPELGPDIPYDFTVRIFDMEGNLVRTLDSGGEALGDGTALWDTRDQAGNKIGPGLYFYSVNSSGQQSTGVIGIKK